MAEQQSGWALIVHSGAKEIEPEEEEPNRAGCLAAAEAGREVLARGGTATEAVEAAIRVLEADPTFNAGYGADLNADGAVQLDAALMDGATYDVGGVCGTTRSEEHTSELQLRQYIAGRLLLDKKNTHGTRGGAIAA